MVCISLNMMAGVIKGSLHSCQQLGWRLGCYLACAVGLVGPYVAAGKRRRVAEQSLLSLGQSLW